MGRVYGAAVCSGAGLSEDLSASSLDEAQRASLLNSIASMMDELEEGERCILWVEDQSSLEKWKSSQESMENERPSGAMLISPIWLKNMDEKPFIFL